MYSINLKEISMETFAETISTVEMLPSRRILPEHISDLTGRLKDRGVTDLAGLQRLLKRKEDYPELATELAVSEEYLALLNREVNSYRSKPLPLAKLEVFTEAELDRFRSVRITSTKDLYESCATRKERDRIAQEIGIPAHRLMDGLELANLVRINGVGPAFALFLRGLSIKGPEGFVAAEPDEILAEYEQSIGQERQPGPPLRREDIEYCRRYSLWLSSDIEW